MQLLKIVIHYFFRLIKCLLLNFVLGKTLNQLLLLRIERLGNVVRNHTNKVLFFMF